LLKKQANTSRLKGFLYHARLSDACKVAQSGFVIWNKNSQVSTVRLFAYN
jgi:hypothetical protein